MYVKHEGFGPLSASRKVTLLLRGDVKAFFLANPQNSCVHRIAFAVEAGRALVFFA